MERDADDANCHMTKEYVRISQCFHLDANKEFGGNAKPVHELLSNVPLGT